MPMKTSATHAAASTPDEVTARGADSYESVALNVGAVVLAVAFAWTVLGAPGVPAADIWVTPEAETFTPLALMAGALMLLGWGMGDSRVDVWGALLRFPLSAFARLVRAAVVLCGVATLGVAALLPGAYLVHVLGLS
jgi:hypothetical protein